MGKGVIWINLDLLGLQEPVAPGWCGQLAALQAGCVLQR